MKIAVDAMGGDYAPTEIVKGSVEAAREYGIPIILVGDQERIQSELAALSASSEPCIEVVHASEVVEMDDHPANAIRRKTDSSIVVAGNLVTKGEAEAMVSAGNTGCRYGCGNDQGRQNSRHPSACYRLVFAYHERQMYPARCGRKCRLQRG